MLFDVWVCRKAKMTATNRKWRSGLEITYISTRTHDSNEIPTATPMIPASGNAQRLLRIQFYTPACWKSKMSAINRK